MRLVAAHGSSKPRGRAGDCARVALKILCLNRRTLLSWWRQGMASQSEGSSSGPFTSRAAIASAYACPPKVSNLPFGASVSADDSSKAHQAHVSSLSRQAFACIQPVIRDSRRRHSPVVPVSCCLSAAGIRFLGLPVPPRDCSFLTIGLPVTAHGAGTSTGFPRSPRMRTDRGGVG